MLMAGWDVSVYTATGVLGRRIIGVPILADADAEALVALAAPAIQAMLTSGLPPEEHIGHQIS
ncbi:hypothetical protein BST11_06470 [Mycobacterium alsense]|uniref:Uncharacterized protein n=1 Tax=Mycobacterium alsense TaxID=324058 RepID=A0AA42BZN0_9MYCO|nr:hypothetical protein [Mycobacterium alsense]MCV7380516.1 hypothetical protein [Mycobacterium alsense]OQZ92136.1 hypothetical protein BST11_06470 [Mycobacterium alsense]